jgi:hypothetical protein
MSIWEGSAKVAIKNLHFSDNPNAQPVVDFIRGGFELGYYEAQRCESLTQQALDAERHQRMRIRQREVILDRRMA